MIEVIFRWIGEHSTFLFVVIATGVVVWYVGKAFWGAKHRVEKAEERLDNLPCEKHAAEISAHSAMSETLNSINAQVTAISKWVIQFDNSSDTVNALVQKRSPRVMTPLGRSLFDISGAKETVEKNLPFFIEEVSKRNPETPYDVENISLDILFKNIGSPIFNSIKNYIYYQPEEIELATESGEKKKVKISLLSIVQLMGLEIRDKYLNSHPEIQP